METLENTMSPVDWFIHQARVLPHFDLGDELEAFRSEHGEEATAEAEQAYWAMKEENK